MRAFLRRNYAVDLCRATRVGSTLLSARGSLGIVHRPEEEALSFDRVNNVLWLRAKSPCASFPDFSLPISFPAAADLREVRTSDVICYDNAGALFLMKPVKDHRTSMLSAIL